MRAIRVQVIAPSTGPMFRLEQKHSRRPGQRIAAVDAQKLIGMQSIRAAIAGAAIAVLGCNLLWLYTASVSERFFPWISMLQGAAIGLVVRHAGRGLDWRFPVIAAAAACIGAFSGNLWIALFFTASETGTIGAGWRQILESFARNTVSVIDVIYAFCAAALAAFFANRRLTRHEVLALRNYHDDKS